MKLRSSTGATSTPGRRAWLRLAIASALGTLARRPPSPVPRAEPEKPAESPSGGPIATGRVDVPSGYATVPATPFRVDLWAGSPEPDTARYVRAEARLDDGTTVTLRLLPRHLDPQVLARGPQPTPVATIELWRPSACKGFVMIRRRWMADQARACRLCAVCNGISGDGEPEGQADCIVTIRESPASPGPATEADAAMWSEIERRSLR